MSRGSAGGGPEATPPEGTTPAEPVTAAPGPVAPHLPGGSGGGGGADLELYTDVDALATAGRRLHRLAEGFGEKLAPALERVRRVEARQPAGRDDAGRAFHSGYDTPDVDGGVGAAEALRLVAERLADAYMAHGTVVEATASAYGEADSAAGVRTAAHEQGFGPR